MFIIDITTITSMTKEMLYSFTFLLFFYKFLVARVTFIIEERQKKPPSSHSHDLIWTAFHS